MAISDLARMLVLGHGGQELETHMSAGSVERTSPRPDRRRPPRSGAAWVNQSFRAGPLDR